MAKRFSILTGEVEEYDEKALKKLKERISEKEPLKKDFEKKARYRTTQINIVKINGVISAHATIKAEYLLLFNSLNKVEVLLEDSIYNFHTKGTEQLAELIRVTDTVKKKMVYALDSKGRLKDLLNFSEVQETWERFKKNASNFASFQKVDAQHIIKLNQAGNVEYYDKELLLKNSNSNLFNQIIFSQYLTKEFENFEAETFDTQSHFFPEIQFTVNCETKQQREEENSISYAKKGTPLFINKSKMIALYEKLYKKQIEYKFTDYIYDFNTHFTVSKEDGLIDKATVTISERIKNNMESEVIYELKRVEL